MSKLNAETQAVGGRGNNISGVNTTGLIVMSSLVFFFFLRLEVNTIKIKRLVLFEKPQSLNSCPEEIRNLKSYGFTSALLEY